MSQVCKQCGGHEEPFHRRLCASCERMRHKEYYRLHGAKRRAYQRAYDTYRYWHDTAYRTRQNTKYRKQTD